MANEVNYNGIIRSADDYLALEQSLPSNDSADGNGGSFKLAGAQGALEVVAEVAEEVTVLNTKALTIALHESDDDETFAAKQTLYTITSDGGDVLAAGTELGRYLLPTDIKDYVKAVLTTTNATAGKVNVFVRYVAR